MKNIAKLILESLKKQKNDGLTVEQAKNTAHFSILLHTTDTTDMPQENMFSYRYIYVDGSELIIDDEGYIYCDEDSEINVLCETNN